MIKCFLLSLTGVNWVMLYEEMKYWKMRLRRKG